MNESNRIELKRELSDSLEKEVVAFLNYRDGGIIYIGIDGKTGKTWGVVNGDRLQLKIKDRIKNNILPSTLGLFDIIQMEKEGKTIIKITLASGPEKPYYIKKHGMSEKGCFLRVGSASEPMPVRMIEKLFACRTRNSIGKIRSPRKKLTFEQLKIYYNERGLDLTDNFIANLELFTEENELNYAAYLLADVNGTSIKVAKYSRQDRVDLIENNEYGYCSLIKACKQVLSKLDIENRTLTKITPRERIEKRLIEPIALREAVINAIVHNDYSREIPPKFEIFSDRLEITSSGGLPQGLNRDEFFNGYSVPRNKELMRIFKDVELVEYLGSGVPRILENYDPSIFKITDNFIRVVFDFHKGEDSSGRLKKLELKEELKSLYEVIKQKPGINAKDISLQLTDRSIKTIDRQLAILKQNKMIERRGSRKTGGYWALVDNESSNDTKYDELSMELKSLYEVIRQNPGINAKDISLQLTDRSIKTIDRQLTILKQKKLIERRGSRKAGGYWTLEFDSSLNEGLNEGLNE